MNTVFSSMKKAYIDFNVVITSIIAEHFCLRSDYHDGFLYCVVAQ